MYIQGCSQAGHVERSVRLDTAKSQRWRLSLLLARRERCARILSRFQASLYSCNSVVRAESDDRRSGQLAPRMVLLDPHMVWSRTMCSQLKYTYPKKREDTTVSSFFMQKKNNTWKTSKCYFSLSSCNSPTNGCRGIGNPCATRLNLFPRCTNNRLNPISRRISCLF